MIFALDHIVFAVSQADQQQLLARLPQAGFRPEPFRLEFPEIGAASESLSFPSGAFVEFVVELDATLSPRVWFHDVPRAIGLGFASNDFEADTWWRDEPGAWVMDEEHLLPDGRLLRIHAAGPHQHQSDFYVFVMDRADGKLEFPEHRSGPLQLRSITLTGADAPAWHERLGRWLNVPSPREDTLQVGEMQLRFQAAQRPSVRATPTFKVSSGSFPELPAGLLEVVPAQPLGPGASG
jgi:Glyoxalase-like domain